MTDSQKHRPAALVTASPQGRLKKELEKAANLETQLGKLPKSSEDKASRIRSQLCEILSDILIADPNLGLEKDCAGRLWRLCFYAPIGVWRNRVNREKRKNGQNLAKLEQSFKKFLEEAITLYDYLVVQYKSKLLPSDSQATGVESSQDSTVSFGGNHNNSNNKDASFTVADGAISGLCRLYIHMGDLYRYAQSFGKSENCYLNAAKLAPGMGNPYNQLAVVAQIRDASMSCVALYWYARSLLATHDPFDVSSGNLGRLFSLNRDYLKEHSRDATAPILQLSQTNGADGSNNNNSNKKASQEQAQKRKAAASKSCLAHFVDLHFHFFKGEKEDEGVSVEGKMLAMAKSFESLLEAQGFGDALLCKMVAINTFSVFLDKQRNPATKIEGLTAAEIFLFCFATCLAKRLVSGLKRLMEKPVNKMPQSIRLLLPLLLLYEFIDHMDYIESSSNMTEFWKTIAEVANLSTHVSKLSSTEGSGNASTQAESSVLRGSSSSLPVPLKDYRNLKGFKPFGFLHESYAADPDAAFVSPEEAVDVLELTPFSSTQESNASSVVVGGAEENVVKIARFLELCKHSASNDKLPLCRLEDGSYIFSESRPEEQKEDHPMADVEEPMDDTGVAMEENEDPVASPMIPQEEDDAGDVVVYKAPEAGDGPPLLVPGALLGSTPSKPKTSRPGATTPTTETTATSPPNNYHNHIMDNRSPLASVINGKRNELPTASANQAQQPDTSVEMDLGGEKLVSPPPPGLLPPPGFGMSSATPGVPPSASGFLPIPSLAQGMYAPPMAGPPQGAPHNHHQQANFFGQGGGHHAPHQNMMGAPAPPMSMYGQTGGMNLGDSTQWFGGQAGLQTANPFAQSPAVNLSLLNNNGNHNRGTGGFESEATTVEGTALLDSGLLSSLWGMDNDNGANKTKNPFAAKY